MAAKRNRKPADEAQPANLAEAQAALQDARDRIADAKRKLIENDRHPSAVQQLHAAAADKLLCEELCVTFRDVETAKAEAAQVEAERVSAAEARDKARQIEDGVASDVLPACRELKAALAAVAAAAQKIDAWQRASAAGIFGLPGEKRVKVQAVNTVGLLSVPVMLRNELRALADVKALSSCISVTVPSEPSRQPIQGESHRDAQARVAALPQTVDEIVAAFAQNLQGRLAALLGPAPESNPPYVPSEKGREPSSADVILKFDDNAQKARTAKRLKDANVPITRDKDGNVLSALTSELVADDAIGAAE